MIDRPNEDAAKTKAAEETRTDRLGKPTGKTPEEMRRERLGVPASEPVPPAKG